jgi:hypothetical protein
MRTTAGVIVNPSKIPENYVKPISAQRQTDGRRAGLKIRWGNTRVSSSATLQATYQHFIFIMIAEHSDKGDID